MPSGGVSIKITGWDEIQKNFAKSPQTFVSVFDKAIKRATLDVLGHVRPVTPIDTGFLRGPGMQTTFEALIGRIENDAPYAGFVHDGTKYMPGRPFFDWGVDAAQSSIDTIFNDAAAEFTSLI